VWLEQVEAVTLTSNTVEPLYLNLKLKLKFNQLERSSIQNTQNKAHKNHNHKLTNRIPKLTTVR
jgi:hypothetical protein